MTCTWRRGPTGDWLVFGLHSELVAAQADNEPVWVRNRDGNHSEIWIERVTSPNYEGYCYGYPRGLLAHEETVTQLETVPAPTSRNVVRPRKGYAAKRSIARRSGRARHRR